MRPEETWAQVMVGGGRALHSRAAEDVRRCLRLTEWTPVGGELDASRAWRGVEDNLLVYATRDPGRPLTGRAGVLSALENGQTLARRAAAWPTVAVETAVEIAPMPFMPRGRDLVGAEMVGARIASLERGHEVFGLTLTGSALTGRRWRNAAPRLDGRRSLAEVLDGFSASDRHEVRKILSWLDDAGLLEARSGPPEPASALDEAREAQVTWLGHAAVLFQTATTRILVDPLFFAPSDPPERWDSASRFDPRALPPLDAILVTHGDNDHLNPNSLALLDPSTQVLIPSCASVPSAFQVDIRGALRVLGFETVVEMAPGTGHQVGDAYVTAWPFEGEDWGLDLPKVTYLVESKELSAFFSADSARMDDVMTAIGKRDRRVDLAFMGVSGNAEPHVTPPELGYGNFYADWVPRARHNAWVQHCADPSDAVESVRRLKPRFAFGYAAGGASFIRTAYSDVGDHETFARLLNEANRGLGSREFGSSGAQICHPVNLPLGQPVARSRLASWVAEPVSGRPPTG